MAFRVDFTRRATSDIAITEAQLALIGVAAVRRWRLRLLKIVQSLEADPLCYPVSDDAADVGLDLREALYGKRPHVYRVFFTVQGEWVVIHRVRHAARDQLGPGDV